MYLLICTFSSVIRICSYLQKKAAVVVIYRGYKGDREDLNDPMSAAIFRSNLILILRKRGKKN